MQGAGLSTGPRTAAPAAGWRALARPSWPLVVAIGVFLYALRQAQRLLADGDTLWHLAAGRWILQHGSIPDRDPFSHTMPGAPWTAHEWLSEVLLALAHDAAGFEGVVALAAAAFALAVALLVRTLLRWIEPVHALLFATFAVFLTGTHLLARPHVLAMPLLVGWVAVLVRARDEGRAPPLAFAALMTLWANLHGGFTLGLAVAGALAAEAVLQAPAARRLPTARAWGMFLAAATGAALITPHGPEAFWFTWHVMTGLASALERIAEWQPTSFQHFGPLELWLLGGLAVALHQGLRLPPMRLLLLLGFLHLALRHARNGELLGLVVPLLLAQPLAAHWQARDRQAPRAQAEGLDRAFASLTAPAGAAALAATAALFAAGPWGLARNGGVTLPADIAPQAALQAVRDARITGPVLNTYAWGGYLIHEGVRPFIDGRADLYGDAFFRAYTAAVDAPSPAPLQQTLDRHGITWTLLPPGRPAVAHLDTLPGWRRLHADRTAVVHVRTDPGATPPTPVTSR